MTPSGAETPVFDEYAILLIHDLSYESTDPPIANSDGVLVRFRVHLAPDRGGNPTAWDSSTPPRKPLFVAK